MATSRGRLKGKVAVVTGASRGIGLAIATSLAAEGCDLVLAARDTRKLRSASQSLRAKSPQKIWLKACDVSDPKHVKALFRSVEGHARKIDILINNAGIAHDLAPIRELDPRKWNEVIATNLTGMFLVSRAAIPLMKPGGIIVNNLSMAAIHVFPGMAAYTASKWGALGLTNALREELREKSVRVLALLPGATDTDIWEQFWREAPHEKMVKPEEVAQAVLAAVTMPGRTAIDEIRIGPAAGKL